MHRNVGQGKRCTICSRLDEERALAATQEAKVAVLNEKNKHIDSVMRDRAVNVRGNTLAEMNAQNPTPHGLTSILKVVVDGMDQAKFKTPRCAVGPGQTCNRSRVRGWLECDTCACKDWGRQNLQRAGGQGNHMRRLMSAQRPRRLEPDKSSLLCAPSLLRPMCSLGRSVSTHVITQCW